MNKIFNKFAMLAGLLSMFGVTSSKAFKELPARVTGEKRSLSKYAENNFGNLSMKRVKGKWRLKK